MISKFVDLLGMVVGVAMVTTIVSHPASADILKAGGQAFSGVLSAAQGK